MTLAQSVALYWINNRHQTWILVLDLTVFQIEAAGGSTSFLSEDHWCQILFQWCFVPFFCSIGELLAQVWFNCCWLCYFIGLLTHRCFINSYTSVDCYLIGVCIQNFVTFVRLTVADKADKYTFHSTMLFAFKDFFFSGFLPFYFSYRVFSVAFACKQFLR